MNFGCTLFAALLLAQSLHAAADSRSVESFDFDWRFHSGEAAGAEAPLFDDRDWSPLDLPHDFAIKGPFEKDVEGGTASGFRPLGVGWYRKNFVTPVGSEGRKVWLDFEGVYRAPKVWVNGALVAEGDNGYVGFLCDVTPHLKPAGQTNVVAVRADNTVPKTSRWYTGGGIYRHVHLIVAGQIHAVQHGTAIATPRIEAEAATVEAAIEVVNEGRDMAWTSVNSVILDPGGRPVADAGTRLPIRAGETVTVRQHFTVPKPVLWDLSNPALYRMDTRIAANGADQDQQSIPFGIRTIRITRDGVTLNGRREFLKGLCIHHDLGCLGGAAFDRAIERRLLSMKEVGCNAVRLAHNPHSSSVLDLCDRLGILVYNEAFDDRNGQFYGCDHKAWKRRWAEDLRWFVRRDRNHPSVFIWSVGNEGSDIFQPPDYGVDQSKAMADLVRQLEPTRPVTQALYPLRWDAHRWDTRDKFPDWMNDPPHQVAFHMDVMSANYMERFWAKDRADYPQLAYISSESHTVSNGREAWNALDRRTAAGLFYWGGFNYIGESFNWPLKGWTAGYFDLTGFRRPGSWDLESFFSDLPMVRIVIDRPESKRVWNGVEIASSALLGHWNFTTGTPLNVEAYSNAEEVELLLNGRSLGVKQRIGEPGTGPRLVWNVPFEAGTLTAIACSRGREVARHDLRTAGAAQTLRLIPDQNRLKADGQDLAHVRVEVVDAAGTVVPDARQMVSFAVTGAGSIAGVDNGDLASDELFQADRRSAHEGVALVVIRASRTAGSITLTATADGLKPTTIQLQSGRDGQARE